MLNKVFIGYDHRQPVSFTVLAQSIIEKTSKPVSIIPLILPTLPIDRQGLTPFTYSRFLVPYLSDFKGWSLFLDIDMIVLDDISNIFDLANDRYTVQVVKNKHKFEWSSVMLFNNQKCQKLTPDFVQNERVLHDLSWCDDSQIGDLPPEWNHLVGYDEPRKEPKLVHYTQGVPFYPETSRSEYREEWQNCLHRAVDSKAWATLMGNSVHAAEVNGVRLPKFLIDLENKCVKPEYVEFVSDFLTRTKRESNG